MLLAVASSMLKCLHNINHHKHAGFDQHPFVWRIRLATHPFVSCISGHSTVRLLGEHQCRVALAAAGPQRKGGQHATRRPPLMVHMSRVPRRIRSA